MTSVLVFDNTALSHFSRAELMGALEKLVAPYRCVAPTEVVRELQFARSTQQPLTIVGLAHWLEVVELDDLDEVERFAQYKSELGGGEDRNNGEAAVLAWARVHGGVALIDERAATRIARREGIEAHGSLWLVANGFKRRLIDRKAAEHVVEELIESGMALPVADGSEFFTWAIGEGLLE